MAHLLSDYKGKCSFLHGHSYKLEVSITGELAEGTDMLVDFNVIKELVEKEVIILLDHRLVLKDNHQNIKRFAISGEDVLWLPFEPTAERLILWIKEKIAIGLPKNIELYRLKLSETNTCFVEWINDR